MIAIVTVGACLVVSPAFAQKAGDIIVRVGPARVMPNDDSGEVKPLAGTGVEVDDATSLGFTFSYLYTDNIGIGLLGALPFEHDIKGDKGAIDGVDIGSIKQLPPTLVVEYYFQPNKPVRPYIGAGINYTYFFDEDADSELEGIVGDTDIDLDDSFGLAAVGGVDVDINDDWFFNASVWYIDIDTTAKLKTEDAGNLKVDVDIDPWVVMLGVGTRF